MVDLVVETGTGSATANSYATIAEANAYFESRGFADWAAISPDDADEKKVALIKATAYLDGRYRGRWMGARVKDDQALAWPRSDVLDEDGIEVADNAVPTRLKQATFEVAKRMLSGDIYVDWTPGASNIISESKTVGPLSKSRTYDTPAPGQQAVLAAVDDLLYGLVRRSRTNFVQRA